MVIKKRHFPFGKLILGCFLGLTLLLIVGVSVLPTWVSTSRGKQWTLRQINKYISGTLTIDRLSLSWWGNQSVEGFSLKDKNGQEALSFDSFSSEGSLFSFLFGKLLNSYSLGNTTLIAPSLHLVENNEGELNLSEALSKKGSKKKSSEKEKKRTIPSIKGDILISQGEIFLTTPKIEPVIITDLNVQIKEEPDLFHVTGKTKQGNVEGGILASGTFHEALFLLVNVEQFPLAVLDQWWETSLFTESLGKTLSMDVELRRTSKQIMLSSNVQTPLLKGSFKGSTKDGKFVLDPGGQAIWTLTPSFFKQVIERSATEKWRLASKTDLLLNIRQLEFPLALKKLQWQQILFTGNVSVNRAEITHTELGHFSLNNFNADLSTSDTLQMNYVGQIQGSSGTTQMEGDLSLDSKQKLTFDMVWKGFPVDLFQLAADEAVYLRTLVGPTFDFMTIGTYEKKHLKARVNMGSSQAMLQGTVDSPNMEDVSIDLSGDIFYPQRYSAILGPSPRIKLHADASIANRTFSIPNIDVKLQNPYWTFDIRGKLGEKGKYFNYNQVKLVASGLIHELPIQEHHILIHDGKLQIEVEGAANVIHSNIELTTSLHNHPEKRSADATVEIKNFVRDEKLDFNRAEILAKGNFTSFPIAILNPFVSEKVNLVSLFGPALDLQLTGAYTPEGAHKATIDMEMKGQDLNGTLSVALDGTLAVSQAQPAFVHWELTPARYQLLMKLLRPDQEPDYVLTRGASVDLTITQLMCPTNAPPKITSFLCQSGFIGEIKVGPLHFKSRKGKEELALLETTGSIQGENLSKGIELHGKGKIVSPTVPSGEQAGFAFDGKWVGFWTPEGTFNRQGTFLGELSLDLLPVQEFTGILPLDSVSRKQVQALLGPLVNARIYGEISQMTGSLTVDIKSSNLKAILPIQLGGGYITLRKTVEAELTLTEEINEIFLKDAIPILITGAWSEHPLRVFLDAEGFSLQFHPFSLRGIQIEKGVIDLGKLRVRNGGDIQALVQFLKAKEITEEGIMEAWFTPIFFSLKDGIAKYQRFDALLAGNVHIALWGKIDLNKDKVNMTLGISPATLQQRFNIKGISKNEMFQVKMRGSTSKVELDWSAASTRIGILIARSAGHIGFLVGGILEQLIGTVGEEDTPPPTTSPFPWESSTRKNGR